MLEPDAVKAASPVLKGAGHSNVPGLPGTTGHAARASDALDHQLVASRVAPLLAEHKNVQTTPARFCDSSELVATTSLEEPVAEPIVS